jgi:hypothetical protein
MGENTAVGDQRVIDAHRDNNTDQSREWGEFIVWAVNSHAELLSALRSIVGTIESAGYGLHCGSFSYDQLKAAWAALENAVLEKAEGTVPTNTDLATHCYDRTGFCCCGKWHLAPEAGTSMITLAVTNTPRMEDKTQ